MPAQSHLFTYRGQNPNGWGENLGEAVSGVGDVNRDGFGDLLIGSLSGGGFGEGGVAIRSGADGRLLFEYEGGEGGAEFGASGEGIGDANGDGVPDFIVGAPWEFGGLGDATVFSGATGGLLFRVSRDNPCGSPGMRCNIGQAVAAAGDLNGDGKADVLVGAPGRANPTDFGFVIAYSLHPVPQVLYRLDGTAGSPIGAEIGGAGDVDADGRDDFIVGGTSVTIFSGANGSVLHNLSGEGAIGVGDIENDGHDDYVVWGSNTARLYSGRTHTVIHTFLGGGRSAAAGDFDRDGIPDVLVDAQIGFINVYSGKTGTLIDSFAGIRMHAAGDVNGDGNPDIIVGNPTQDLGKGIATVYSSVTMALATEEHTASISALETQRFRLDAGIRNAGRMYWIVGGLSGTSPGFRVGAVMIPIRIDDYTHCTIEDVNFISGGLGSLDGAGRARAALRIPAGTPAAMIGRIAHHAYAVFTPRSNFFLASNAVPLLLAK